MCVGKQDRLHAEVGACTQVGQDLSNCSALPVLMSFPPRSRSAPPSAPGELCVTRTRLPQPSALLPFIIGEGHCSLAQSSIPAIATQLQPAPSDAEYGCWVA